MTNQFTNVDAIETRRKRKRRMWTFSVATILVWGVMVGALWTIRWSSIFSVRDIKVEGTHYVSASHVMNAVAANMFYGARWKLLLGMRHMWAWPDSINQKTLVLVPEIETIAVKKDYRAHRIVFAAEERTRVGVWCFEKISPSRCVWFDKNGIALREAFSGEGPLITVIRDTAQERVSLGNEVLTADLFQNLISALDVAYQSEFRIKEIILEDLSREEISISTYDGPSILVSLRFPLRGISEILSEIESKTNIAELKYIDFRVEGRAYYK